MPCRQLRQGDSIYVPSSPEEGGHLGTGTHLLQPY